MRYPLPMLVLGLLANGCLSADAPSNDADLEVTIAALGLDGADDAVWDVQVVSRCPSSVGAVVWERRLSASRYGAGASVSYVGTCDAEDGGCDNDVNVRLVGVYGREVSDPGSFAAAAPDDDVGQASLDFVDPGVLSEQVQCVANADTQVTFDVTVMRPARQGFFDIAVSFDDVFCSAKVDCVSSDGTPKLLLHDANGARGPTTIVALACTAGADTAGANTTTTLHLDDLVIDCGGTPTTETVDPAQHGNVFIPARAAGTSVFYQAQVSAGVEALGNAGTALSANKLYWTVALGVDLTALATAAAGCQLRTRFTASQGDNDLSWSPVGTYPVIEVDVPLSVGGDGALDCGGDNAHGLDELLEQGLGYLETDYPPAPAPFDNCARDGGDDIEFCSDTLTALAALCPNSPAGALEALPGCAALSLLEQPELFAGPLIDELTEVELAFGGSFGAAGALRDIASAIAATRQEITIAMTTARSGDACGAAALLAGAPADLATARGQLVPIVADLRAATPLDDAHGDAGTYDTHDLNVAIGHHALGELGAYAETLASSYDLVCAEGTPVSRMSATVAEVRDDQGRLVLTDGRIFSFAEGAGATGALVPGSMVTIDGLDLGDGTGVAIGVATAESASEVPQARCLWLRFAPVQPFAPYASGPYTLHDMPGYDSGGQYLLEHGMALAVEQTCPPSDNRYSIDAKLDYTDRDGNTVTDHPWAPDMIDGDHPAILPYNIDEGSVATLKVETRVQDCSTQPCGQPTTITDEIFTLLIKRRGSLCSATFNTNELDVNDQIPDAWRQNWVTGFDAPLPVGTGSYFQAEGYEQCPDGAGGFVSCYPQLSPIFEAHSFVVHNHDFYPIHPKLGLAGVLQKIHGQGLHGVDHAAGLRWPTLRSQRSGFDNWYSCSLPQLVRDVVNFCPAEGINAYYRLPFPEDVDFWIQGQGNRPGCSGCPAWADGKCCNSHNYSWALDMVAPCGSELLASRAGRVVEVTETNFRQVHHPCTDGECAGLVCCPRTWDSVAGEYVYDDCPANRLVIRHQDDSFSLYVHTRLFGIQPDLGDFVRRGETIAYVGSTGPSSGAHLHYEARVDLTASTPPYGTLLALFEVRHSETNAVVPCYEPVDRPASDSPDYHLRSNNPRWP